MQPEHISALGPSLPIMVESFSPTNSVPIIAAPALLEDAQALLGHPVVALAFIFAVGALGLYMLLPGEKPFSASAVKWFGGPLMVISFILLASLTSVQAGWWPRIPESEQVSRIAFAILALVALAAAARAVIARRMTSCVGWLAVLLAANTSMLVLHGALLAAASNALLTACTLIALRVWIVPASRVVDAVDRSGAPANSEPFLACLTGALLCVVLVAAITHATSGGDLHEAERLARTMSRKREVLVEDKLKHFRTDTPGRHLPGRLALVMQEFVERPAGLLAGLTLLLSSFAGAICIASRRRSAPCTTDKLSANAEMNRDERRN